MHYFVSFIAAVHISCQIKVNDVHKTWRVMETFGMIDCSNAAAFCTRHSNFLPERERSIRKVIVLEPTSLS